MLNNETKLTKYSLVILGVILAMFFMTSARAAAGDFSDLWYSTNAQVLQKYLNADDKSEWDKGLDIWIDGAVGGIFATYGYQSGMGVAISNCVYDSVLQPKKMRKVLLQAGSNPVLKDLTVGAYIYAIVHFACEDTMGEYEYDEDDIGS